MEKTAAKFKDRRAFGTESFDTPDGFYLRTFNGFPQIGINNSFPSTGSSIADDEWHHVAFVFTGSEGRWNAFLDGERVNEGDAPVYDLIDTGVANIGINETASGSYWNGGLDDMRFFGRDLRPIEIKQIYAEQA